MWWGPIPGASLYGISKVIFLKIMIMHIFIKNFLDLCNSSVRHIGANNYCSVEHTTHVI